MTRFPIVMAVVCLAAHAGNKPKKDQSLTPLDRYVRDATSHPPQPAASAGSTWSPGSRLGDLGSDLRASQVDDVVTVLVLEQASATAQGVTKTQRQSSANASVTAAGGAIKARSPWANLANTNANTQLEGQGQTTRQTSLSTTLSARVVAVLPNGNLVIEGAKEVQVNSERQTIVVRGVVRPLDLSSDNVVRSDRIAQMEVRMNGRGVVGDAVRRPFILYRLLMGLLPF